jgi:hypothetical protein
MALAVTRGWRPESLRISFGRAAVVAVSMTLVLVLPLAVLRQYQQRELRVYFQRYIDAPKVPLTTAPTEPAFVEVDVDAGACGGVTSVGAFYKTSNPAMDYSRTFALDARGATHTGGVTRVFFPVYRYFQGVTLSSVNPECGVSAFRVTDVRPFPILMTAVLAPGWERQPLYQRFR